MIMDLIILSAISIFIFVIILFFILAYIFYIGIKYFDDYDRGIR